MFLIAFGVAWALTLALLGRGGAEAQSRRPVEKPLAQGARARRGTARRGVEAGCHAMMKLCGEPMQPRGG